MEKKDIDVFRQEGRKLRDNNSSNKAQSMPSEADRESWQCSSLGASPADRSWGFGKLAVE